MSAERGWIVPPRPNPHSVEAWAERHRRDGHHPHPAPTAENPERGECKCDPDAAWTAVWRILTVEQIGRKFAHLKSAKKRTEEQDRRDAERHLREKLWATTRPVARPTNNAGTLEIAERYRKSSMP